MATGFRLGKRAVAGSTLRPGWPLFALGLALLVWFLPWLVSAEPRMGGDVTIEHYPRLTYAVGQVRAGMLPLWASLTMGGVPFLANPQVALFYPPHWPLLALLPVGAMLNWTAALHVGLAAFATYALGRHWSLSPGAAALAAVCYAFNGLFAVRLWAGQVGIVAMAAWLPALLLAADRLRERPDGRGVGIMATALTLSLLVGAYQPWFLAVIVVGLFLATMPGTPGDRLRRITGLALAGLVSVGLAAPQLLPAAELVRWSVRAGRLDWAFATDASLPLWHLPTLLLPELFGSGAGTYWPAPWWHWHELTAYAGLLPLVVLPLGLLPPREPWVRFCAVLAFVAVVLALGRYTPVYGWLYDWMPGYGSFRDPARHLVLVSLAVALLGGRGADRLLAGRGYRPVTLALLGLVVAAAIGALVAVRASDDLAPAVVPFLQGHGLWQARPESAAIGPADLGAAVLLLVARACGMAVVAAAIGLVAVVLARRGPPARRSLLLAAAVFADLTLLGWRYLHEPLPLAPGVPFGPPEEQFARLLGETNVAQLQNVESLGRVAVTGQLGAVAANAGYALGIPLAMGLDPLLPRRYAELVAQIDDRPLAAFENLVLYLEDRPSPLWSLLNAPYRLVPSEAVAAGRPVRYELRAGQTALPRVFAADALDFVASDEESLTALRGLDPTRRVILQAEGPATITGDLAGLPAPPTGGTALRPVDLTGYAPGEVTARVDLPAGGAVVLLESWHPGWRAMIDGSDAPVYPADHAFLAVLVPAGPHEVRFRFESVWLSVGALAALVTTSLLVLAIALTGGRRPRPPRTRGIERAGES